MRKIIGITGGIACGKTFVTSYLKSLGYPVIDTDLIAKTITLKGNEGYEPVIKRFPYLTEDLEIDRKRLGEDVFHNEKNRLELNQILHPIIYQKTKSEIEKYDGIVFVDVPLMFEAHFDTLCDRVCCVYVDLSTQIKRLTQRDHITDDYAMAKINSQMPLKEKMDKSDYLLHSEEDFNLTKKNIEKLLEDIKEEQYA